MISTYSVGLLIAPVLKPGATASRSTAPGLYDWHTGTSSPGRVTTGGVTMDRFLSARWQ